ncbi:C-terminal LisH motif isoform 2 [Hibiscus syriacus]|uniref:C-terminal LisH motif isoform 2 n=1 Tax=Hibiscus syriacus TaxID=106335 RepID=A0A6A3AQU3_HIBSY|nr:C-terminal LisH motif isoform 2 [Hibiscus syriacus]
MNSWPVNWEALDALIIDFAKSENLIDDSSPPSSPSLSSSYHSRLIIRQIRRSLHVGNIDTAIDLLRVHAPFVLEDQRLLSRLQKLKFIELLRKGTRDYHAFAVDYLRKSLAPCALNAYPRMRNSSMFFLPLYNKYDLTSPVANEWAEKRRYDIAGLLSSVLRAHFHAYNPIFSITLRYLMSIHKGFCFRQGIVSPISNLTERLLLEECDFPAIPPESLYEAQVLDEVDIQALAHAVELTRQGAIDSLRFSKGDLFEAFQGNCGSGMKTLSEPLKGNPPESGCYSSLESSIDVDHRGAKRSNSETSANTDLSSMQGTDSELRFASEPSNNLEDCSPSGSHHSENSSLLRNRSHGAGERSKCKQWRGRCDELDFISVNHFDQYGKEEGVENTNVEDKYEIVLRMKELSSIGMAAEGCMLPLGPLAACDPTLPNPLKETLVSLLRPSEDTLVTGLPLHALATALQVAFGKRLGIEEPHLEFLALPRADAIHLLAQYKGNAETRVKKITSNLSRFARGWGLPQIKEEDDSTEKSKTTKIHVEKELEQVDSPEAEPAHDEQEPESFEAPTTRQSDRVRRRPNWHSYYVIEGNIAYCLLTENGEPSTYQEAINSSDVSLWMMAMQEEIEALYKNNTWDFVPLPQGRKPVGNKWVFKIMRNVRVVLAICAILNLHLEQLDVKITFLHGNLEEEIYMLQPEGPNKDHIEELKAQLAREFEMKDLGSANKILGMQIHQDIREKKELSGKLSYSSSSRISKLKGLESSQARLRVVLRDKYSHRFFGKNFIAPSETHTSCGDSIVHNLNMSGHGSSRSEAGDNRPAESSNSPALARQGEEQAPYGVLVTDQDVFFRTLDAILTRFQPPITSTLRMNIAKELKDLGAPEFKGEAEEGPVVADLCLNYVKIMLDGIHCSNVEKLDGVISLLPGQQVDRTVYEYECEFNKLSHFAAEKDACECLRKAQNERFGNQRTQPSKRTTASSSFAPPKRSRDFDFRSQAQSESMASVARESNQMRARQTQSVGSGDGRAQQSQIRQCEIYGRSHSGTCNVVTGACFRCGEVGHFMRDCPLGTGEPVQSEQSASMSQRRRGRGRGRSQPESSTQQEICSTARVYNMNTNEDFDDPEIIREELRLCFGQMMME